jgi:hypothetical protein
MCGRICPKQNVRATACRPTGEIGISNNFSDETETAGCDR